MTHVPTRNISGPRGAPWHNAASRQPGRGIMAITGSPAGYTSDHVRSAATFNRHRELGARSSPRSPADRGRRRRGRRHTGTDRSGLAAGPRRRHRPDPRGRGGSPASRRTPPPTASNSATTSSSGSTTSLRQPASATTKRAWLPSTADHAPTQPTQAAAQGRRCRTTENTTRHEVGPQPPIRRAHVRIGDPRRYVDLALIRIEEAEDGLASYAHPWQSPFG